MAIFFTWLIPRPYGHSRAEAQGYRARVKNVRFLGTVRLLAVVFVQGHRPRDALEKKRGRLIGFQRCGGAPSRIVM